MKVFYSVVVMLITISAGAQTNISMAQTFRQFAEEGVSQKDLTKSSRNMISYSEKQETEGSPYLLNNWAQATVYLKNNTILKEPSASLNFDKTKNLLLMKLSDQKVLEVNMEQVAGFTLSDGNTTYTLVAIPESGSNYLLTLATGNNFSLYKSLNTKFYKADYANKGLYETGYKYDRYVDENKYYVKKPDGKVYIINSLTKAELKKFSDQIPAAKNYLKSQNLDPANLENTLINLIVNLNQK